MQLWDSGCSMRCFLVFRSIDVIRNALAMGADKGIHVQTDMSTDQELQPLAVAKIFRHVMEENQFDLALLGKQSIDDDYI